MGTNNASKNCDTKSIGNTSKIGNVEENGGGNAIDSVLGGNERPKKAKKDANIVPTALTHRSTNTTVTVALAFFSSASVPTYCQLVSVYAGRPLVLLSRA